MMKKNSKKIKLLFFLIFIFLGFANLIYALEIQNGPCSGNTNIGPCVVNLFNWGIGIAATLAALSFAFGAITFMMSGDNGERASGGKDRMKGSVLGLLLLGSSYLIMTTINPYLLNTNLDDLDTIPDPNVQIPPGVYFYKDASCSGSFESSTTNNIERIGPNINGIKIINSPNVRYGYVLHSAEGLDLGGKCSLPIVNEGCQSTNNMYGAIHVFEISNEPTKSGNGVTFYGRPYGLAKGARAGYYDLKSGMIPAPYKQETAAGMALNYTGVNIPDTYRTICDTFNKCPGSIDIKGKYVVAVYSGSNNYCQVFIKNVDNLNAEPVVAAGTTNLGNIYIIPTGHVDQP